MWPFKLYFSHLFIPVVDFLGPLSWSFHRYQLQYGLLQANAEQRLSNHGFGVY